MNKLDDFLSTIGGMLIFAIPFLLLFVIWLDTTFWLKMAGSDVLVFLILVYAQVVYFDDSANKQDFKNQ